MSLSPSPPTVEQATERPTSTRRRPVALWVALGLVLLVGLIALLVAGINLLDRIAAEQPGERIPAIASGHLEPPTPVTTYTSDPPTSGPHWPLVAPWGVHTEPVANELQVHNLEHGGIVIQYQPSLSPEQVGVLEDITRQCSVKLLLAPRPGLPIPVAVTAWERILRLETADEAEINRFISAYVNEGPERVPSEDALLNECDL